MQKMTHAEFLAKTLKYGDDLSLRVALDCRLCRFVRLSDARTSRLWARMAKWTAADIYTAEYWKVWNRYKRAREFSAYCQNKRYELRGI